MPLDPWCPIERWEPYLFDQPDIVHLPGPDSTILTNPEDAPDSMPPCRPVGFVVTAGKAPKRRRRLRSTR